MNHETLRYTADGVDMLGQLFVPDGPGPRAGVLVFPEAFGIGDHVVECAKRLAALGYVALACDLHGGGRYIDDLAEAMAALAPLFADPTKTRSRAVAALTVLATRPEVDSKRIAAIGFCFPLPLELARSGADLRAVVGFHTGLTSVLPVIAGDTVRPLIVVCIGGDDPFIPPADRLSFEGEMRAAGADWEVDVYGGTVHSFTNPRADARGQPDTLRYSPAADRRAWARMIALLDERLAHD